jgi:hypothetical protein
MVLQAYSAAELPINILRKKTILTMQITLNHTLYMGLL